MNWLINKFREYGITEQEVQEISNFFELKQIKSGAYFIQSNAFADYLGFVENGIFQFYYDNDAEEITTYIALKNDFLISIQSFFAKKPAKESIKALVDSRVWTIKQSDFISIINRYGSFKNFYIGMLELLMVCLDESRFDYITLKPEERYAKLIKQEPELLRQIPLKYLSSLIGVTPRHLSRIRNNIQ